MNFIYQHYVPPSPFLTSIHKSKSVADLAHQSQPNIRDHFPPHTCQVSIQSNFHISQLSVFFQNLSKLFKNHSRGGLRARLLHRRALLSKSIFFKIKTSTVLPEVVKLADHPGNGLPDHVDPLELGRAISPNQVKDVEVSVKEHRRGGIPFQGGNQSSLFTCCQNLCLVKVG